MENKSIVVANITINRDEEGRYCLNDLHKAAGGERRHGPSLWMENQQTKDIIEELSDTGIPVSVIRGGNKQGTFVVKELVYSYAMWISAKFSLEVIRAYDSLQNEAHKCTALPDFTNPAIAARAWADEVEAKMKALAVIEEQKPLVKFANDIATSSDSVLIGDMVKVFPKEWKLGRNKLFKWLREGGYLMSNNMPYQKYVDNGWFEVRESTVDTAYGKKIVFTPMVTGKGQINIVERVRGIN